MTRSSKLVCTELVVGMDVPREIGIQFIAKRILNKCVPGENGCLLFTGLKYHNGYGQASAYGKRVRTHRIIWETAHGPIPEKMAVCHTCDVRACCNIKHLFLGTWQDNALDMCAKGRHLRSPTHYTHCKNGHPFSAENTYVHFSGRRACRTCQRICIRKRAGWPKWAWELPVQPGKRIRDLPDEPLTTDTSGSPGEKP